MFFSKYALSLPLVIALSVMFSETAHAQGELPLKQNQQIIQQHDKTVTQKTQTLNVTTQEVQNLDAKKQTLAKHLQDEKKVVEDLRKKIADKQVAKTAPASVVVQPAAASTTSSASCGDNQYAAYIYGQESGGKIAGNCNPTAQNASGCLGIGQDCNGIMWPRCGANYQCQNQYFTEYVNSRYGGWQGAYNFWINHHWY